MAHPLGPQPKGWAIDGHMGARFLERLLQPVALAVRTMLGAAQATFAYDVLTGEASGSRLFFRF